MLVRRQELGRAPETWNQDETYSVGYHTVLRWLASKRPKQPKLTLTARPHRTGGKFCYFPYF